MSIFAIISLVLCYLATGFFSTWIYTEETSDPKRHLLLFWFFLWPLGIAAFLCIGLCFASLSGFEALRDAWRKAK